MVPDNVSVTPEGVNVTLPPTFPFWLIWTVTGPVLELGVGGIELLVQVPLNVPAKLLGKFTPFPDPPQPTSMKPIAMTMGAAIALILKFFMCKVKPQAKPTGPANASIITYYWQFCKKTQLIRLALPAESCNSNCDEG